MISTIHFLLFFLYIGSFLFAVLQETTFAMVFSLIVSFLIACFLVISLGFEFLGYLILIVYVGAIAVLFLFMVMLFDRAEYKLFNIKKTNYETFDVFVGSSMLTFLILIGFWIYIDANYVLTGLNKDSSVTPQIIYSAVEDLKLFKFISLVFPKEISYLNHFNDVQFFNTITISELNFSNLNIHDIELIGLAVYTDYFIILLVAGLGLLVAMIGCIIITRSSFLTKKYRKTQNIDEQLNRFRL